jgi:hypothetical protein
MQAAFIMPGERCQGKIDVCGIFFQSSSTAVEILSMRCDYACGARHLSRPGEALPLKSNCTTAQGTISVDI